MAYIEEFTIHGLAGRSEPVHRVLDRHVNVFWGLNGAGKTSLLKILHSALRCESTLLKRVPFTSAEVVFRSTDHDAVIKRTFINASDSDEDTDEDDFNPPSLEHLGDGLWREVQAEERTWTTEILESKSPPRPDAGFLHTYLPISRMTRGTSPRPYGGQSRAAAVDDAFLDEEFADQVRQKWQTYNADALSYIKVIQQQGLGSILALLFGGAAGPQKAAVEKVDSDQAYALVREFLKEQNIRLRFGKEEFLKRYDQQTDLRGVVSTIQEVAKDVEEATRPQRDFQEVIQSLYSGGKQLMFDRRRFSRGSIHVELNGSTIPLQSLSSGEKQLLRLMLEVLAAETTTVMIDEPELSMHVDWQQVLVDSMRRVNPDCQLLLATHSPEVMADVPDEYVFQL